MSRSWPRCECLVHSFMAIECSQDRSGTRTGTQIGMRLFQMNATFSCPTARLRKQKKASAKALVWSRDTIAEIMRSRAKRTKFIR